MDLFPKPKANNKKEIIIISIDAKEEREKGRERTEGRKGERKVGSKKAKGERKKR